MISYRGFRVEEAEKFWNLMNTLDRETPYMMYEPGEREAKSAGLQNLQSNIQKAINGKDFLLAAEDDGRTVGYIWADRGGLNRTAHTAYIVTGILKSHRGQGIGTRFFEYLDIWAKTNELVRLELTVECPNTAALRLYKKSGFEIEGIRKKSMFVDGNYIDEYYMAKILQDIRR